jgi:hypothetical protein
MALNPWHQLTELGVNVAWVRMDGVLGAYFHDLKTIALDPDMNQAQRRCTVVHELGHAERGFVPVNQTLTAREELWIDQAAAHRLIDIVDLGNALCEADDHNWEGVAGQLWVDTDTLRTRLQHLHPSERAYLRNRIAARDNTEEEQ